MVECYRAGHLIWPLRYRFQSRFEFNSFTHSPARRHLWMISHFLVSHWIYTFCLEFWSAHTTWHVFHQQMKLAEKEDRRWFFRLLFSFISLQRLNACLFVSSNWALLMNMAWLTIRIMKAIFFWHELIQIQQFFVPYYFLNCGFLSVVLSIKEWRVLDLKEMHVLCASVCVSDDRYATILKRHFRGPSTRYVLYAPRIIWFIISNYMITTNVICSKLLNMMGNRGWCCGCAKWNSVQK